MDVDLLHHVMSQGVPRLRLESCAAQCVTRKVDSRRCCTLAARTALRTLCAQLKSPVMMTGFRSRSRRTCAAKSMSQRCVLYTSRRSPSPAQGVSVVGRLQPAGATAHADAGAN